MKETHLESLRKKVQKIQRVARIEDLAKRASRDLTEMAVEGALRPEVARDEVRRGMSKEEQRALKKLENGDYDDLTQREQFQVEAIVEKVGRPVSFIVDGTFQPLDDPWTHFNGGDIKRRIDATIPLVGRVEAQPAFAGGEPRHLGTGFIVGPDLMMTNRHVAELFVRGLGQTRLRFVPQPTVAIDMKRERDFRGDDNSGTLIITDVLIVHPYWDMALFRVDGLPSHTKGLGLSVEAPEDLVERDIAVIGYPGQSRDRSREALELQAQYFGTTFGVKRLAPGDIRPREEIVSFQHLVPAMTHDSSTLPGNSGAALLDVNNGQIVGLHFGGITLKANYCVPMFELARDRRVVDYGLNFKGSVSPTDEWESYWRLSEVQHESSVAAVRGSGAGPGQPVFQSVEPEPQRRRATTPPVAASDRKSVATADASGSPLAFPITVTVTIERSGQANVSTLPAAARTDVSGAAPSEPSESGAFFAESFQEPIIHPDLKKRAGYQPHFLDDSVDVPMPTLTPEGESAVTRLLDGSGYELKYHNFTAVLHKKRRLALFTAANVNWQRRLREINGKKPNRQQLTGIPKGVLEQWVNDPRLDDSDQLPDVFFTKDQGAFDKGHLVRRDDVAWGTTFNQMQKGNGDTYHVTNCSPQVKGFNQSQHGEDNWGDLENMIEKETSREKVCVFCGPVLSQTDRIFKGVTEGGPVKIKIPRQFWKIVVALAPDGPRAYGFVLKQQLDAVPLEFAVPSDWQVYQTPMTEIQELLFGLASLDWFIARDALSR